MDPQITGHPALERKSKGTVYWQATTLSGHSSTNTESIKLSFILLVNVLNEEYNPYRNETCLHSAN